MLALCGLYFFIALQDTLAVSAMNEDTLHIEKTDSLVPFFWPMYLRWSCYARTALDEWNTKLSLSVANTFAYFSGCFVALPPLGGPQSSGCRSGLRHAVLSLATDTIALETR